MSAKSAAIKQRVPVISLANAEPNWVFHLENPNGRFSDEEFERFCAENKGLRIEMTKEGEMIIMMPVTPQSSNRNFLLTTRFGVWTETVEILDQPKEISGGPLLKGFTLKLEGIID
jgi:Uma2 family endonuclease